MTGEVAVNAAQVAQANFILSSIMVIAIRDMIRKGIALRKAGKNQKLIRFICLFIFNTAGILPLIYIFLVDKKSKKTK